jgi:hypothetical protein
VVGLKSDGSFLQRHKQQVGNTRDLIDALAYIDGRGGRPHPHGSECFDARIALVDPQGNAMIHPRIEIRAIGATAQRTQQFGNAKICARFANTERRAVADLVPW